MAARLKLNGWQRIGVILTVIYMGFTVDKTTDNYSSKSEYSIKNNYDMSMLQQYTYVDLKPEWVAERYRLCIRDVTDTLNEDIVDILNLNFELSGRSPEELENDRKREKNKHKVESSDVCDHTKTDNIYRKSPNYILFAFMILIYPLCAWLGIYLILFLIKWVIRGFKTKSDI